MQTVADMIHAFNELFLDFAPAAALIGLAVSWFLRNRRCRETERELRRRIDFYKGQEVQKTEKQDRKTGIGGMP